MFILKAVNCFFFFLSKYWIYKIKTACVWTIKCVFGLFYPSSFTLFEKWARVSCDVLTTIPGKFLKSQIFNWAQNQRLWGGGRRPDGSKKLFKGKQKRNTILSRLPAMVVAYRKEIKALENLRMNLSIQLAYRWHYTICLGSLPAQRESRGKSKACCILKK